MHGKWENTPIPGMGFKFFSLVNKESKFFLMLLYFEKVEVRDNNIYFLCMISSNIIKILSVISKN